MGQRQMFLGSQPEYRGGELWEKSHVLSQPGSTEKAAGAKAPPLGPSGAGMAPAGICMAPIMAWAAARPGPSAATVARRRGVGVIAGAGGEREIAFGLRSGLCE